MTSEMNKLAAFHKREGQLIAAAKAKAKAGMLGATLGTNNTAGSIAATSVAGTVTVTCPAGATVCVQNSATSTANLLVNVDTVHDDADFSTLEAGVPRNYVVRVANPVITFKTASGTATGYAEIVVMPPGTGNR